MSVDQTHQPHPASAAATEPRLRKTWKKWQRHAKRWFDKSHPNYLLHLFTALLAASALIIMLVVGVAIYWIYSSAMVKNAEASAISVVRAIMSAEVDNLLHEAPDGQLMLTVNQEDMARLNLQMHRYLKPFSMHKIKLYTPDKKVIYSTDATLIGEIDQQNEDLEQVLTSGEVLSELERKKDFAELGGGRIHDAAIVEAYSPIFDASHRLLGVFEVYVDITKTRVAIFNVLLLTMTTLGAVLSVCLFSLYLPMKRGTLGLIMAHRELKELATKDYLTGAYNRRYITDRVKQEFHRMRRQNNIDPVKKSVGFIMADIDFFKKVNDTYGHIAGDEVLREISHRLKEGLRDYDVLCRYGGEEFLIMLPHTDERDSMLVAERLRQSIISIPVAVDGIGPVPVTVSFGVASSNDGSESEHAVIARADQALYLAKEGGRNRVILADQPANALHAEHSPSLKLVVEQ
jgi:diguanylate cyclase (GGDEF)-like protein